jgi:hypothetical protein
MAPLLPPFLCLSKMNKIAEIIRKNDTNSLTELIAKLSESEKQTTLDNALFLASSTPTTSIEIFTLLLDLGHSNYFTIVVSINLIDCNFFVQVQIQMQFTNELGVVLQLH